MQVKTTIACYYRPITMVKIEGLTIPSVGKDVGDLDSCTPLVGA